MTSWGRFFTSLFLVVVFECLIALGDKNTDVTEGAVTIVFDSVTATAWSKNGTTQRFQKTISEVANGYCSKNTAKCSLTSWNITRTFESSNVIIVSGFPQRRDGDLDVKFYVTYPSAQDFIGNIKAVLPASILEEIVLANKRNISNDVRATVKSVGVDDDDDDDDDDDKKQTDSFMNYVMIPLTVSLLIILCVLACCLQYCKNKQVRAHEAERRQQLELTNQTKAPTTQMEVHVASGDAHRRKKLVKRMKKKEKHNERLDSSDDAPEAPTQANGTTAVTWFEDEEQSSTKGKSIKHKHRKHRGSVDQQPEEPREESRDSAEQDSETKEDIETDEVDTRDQLQKRRKMKRKKHRKRYSHQVDDERRQAGIVLSDSQLGKLPSIRNLPPLKDRQSVEA